MRRKKLTLEQLFIDTGFAAMWEVKVQQEREQWQTELADKDAELTEKDAEIARLRVTVKTSASCQVRKMK